MKSLVIKYKDILYWVLGICIFQGLLSDYVGAHQINYLCDFLLIGLLVVIICKKQGWIFKYRKNAEFFSILAFTLIIILGWLFHLVSFSRAIWGIRNYGRFFLFFIFALSLWDSNDVNKIEEIFLKLFPFHMILVIYQYIVEGLRQDTLSGLFGKALGGNGGLIIYLSIILCIIICRFEYKQISISKFIIWLLFIFVNAALSELKFFFVLAVLIILWYLFVSKRKGQGMILALFFLIVLYIGVQILYYMFPIWTNYLSFDNIINIILSQKTYASQNDIGRTAVFSKLTPIISDWGGKSALILGIGLGNGDYSNAFPFLNSAFYEVYEKTHYTWLSLGYLFVETGYLGTIAYVSFFIVLEIKSIISYQRRNTYFNLLGTFLPLIFMTFLVYNSIMRSNFAYMAYATLTWQILVDKEKIKMEEGYDI